MKIAQLLFLIKKNSHFGPLFTLLFLANYLSAQIDTTRTEQLQEVTVKAVLISAEKLRVPRAVHVVDFRNTQDIYQQLSFKEYLINIPGISAMNANNFAQDLRISIRGFGSRSAFGIRGIKILVDGIPETTPDGQGQLDNLNLGLIDGLEVIKGPAATLYGNASGGVISISTAYKFENNFFKAGNVIGSNNALKFQTSIGIRKKQSTILIHGTSTSTSGYREQSGFKNKNLQIRLKHELSERSNIGLLLSYNDSPLAEDAGGLTKEEVEADRKQARSRNVEYNTGEDINQLKTGLNYNFQGNSYNFKSYGFFSTRNFEGLLPFDFGGWINLERKYFGLGSSLTFTQQNKNLENSLMVGFDWASQRDDRKRFVNAKGEKGDKTLDQLESFNTVGIYVLDQLQIAKILFSGGLRMDFNELRSSDEHLINGDQSGKIDLKSLNPSLGINYLLNAKNAVFSNFSTGFETPVLSELSANPFENGGFNSKLEPQKAKNFELGYRYESMKIKSELVLFTIQTRNEIIPYELEEFPDRTFYKNAGTTQRHGMEFNTSVFLGKRLTLNAGLSISNFEYRKYSTSAGDFSGNKLPGISEKSGSISLYYKNTNGMQLIFSNSFMGELYADDANIIRENGYMLSSLKGGFKIKSNTVVFTPFFGINNLFDVKYNDNIRINAFGNRYYEPAPGRQFYGGLRINMAN